MYLISILCRIGVSHKRYVFLFNALNPMFKKCIRYLREMVNHKMRDDRQLFLWYIKKYNCMCIRMKRKGR